MKISQCAWQATCTVCGWRGPQEPDRNSAWQHGLIHPSRCPGPTQAVETVDNESQPDTVRGFTP